MQTDPIADLLTRVKNASLVKHDQVMVPYSRLKEQLVKLLVSTGHLASYTTTDRQITIMKPRLKSVKRLSKPGSRLYMPVKRLAFYLRGQGVTILSTAKGLMTVRTAMKNKLGGELICRVG